MDATQRWAEQSLLDSAIINKKRGITLLEFLEKAARYYIHSTQVGTDLQIAWNGTGNNNESIRLLSRNNTD